MSELERTTTAADGAFSIARSLGAAAHGGLNRTQSSNFPLILALAEDESATAAIRMTVALARERGAVPTVVRARGTAACREAVEHQVTAVAGQVDWPLDVTEQTPIDAIIERARLWRAGMIVMGLRGHGVIRRAISRDLLSEVVRVTRVPVLAVRPGSSSLPKRIVVAVDFGGASIRAAHFARHLLADGGAMFLVHVSMENSDRVRTMLDALADELAPAPTMTVSSILLHGDVQSSIEGLAQAVSADLLVVGSEEHSPFDHLRTGSLSIKLAHMARWSTLIVPSRRDD
jgi:nucleotide-binding universal stress UspA family protein